MFNFSANHLFLISRTEYPSCAVLVMLDHDTRRVYRLFDFTKRLHLSPDRAYCVAGKVNSVNTLYLVVESVKLDTKHGPRSTSPVPADGREGSHLVTLLPFLTTGTVAPIADDSAGVSADIETGAPCGRLSGASAVIPGRR